MSGVIYLRDIPAQYRQIGDTIDNIDNNDSRRMAERKKGEINKGQKGDGKLDGFEYNLFCKQLKEQINFETMDDVLPPDAYHCWGDQVKFASQKYESTINELNQAADLRQNKGNGPMQWVYNLLHSIGINI